MAQSNSWCITLNNPTEEEQSVFETIYDVGESVQYLVFQIEEGEKSTVHVQAFVQFKKRLRVAGVKRIFGNRIHVEIAKGTALQNTVYCTKSEGRLEGPFKFGDPVERGKRNDLIAFKDAMKENIMSDSEILDQYPTILAKYPRFVATTRRILSEANLVSTPYVPRSGWQTSLENTLNDRPDPRKVLWYFDNIGASGKSYFAKQFRLRDGGRPYICTGGKYADIYYAYSRQSVVIFDWPRSQEEAFPYSVVETFKNGYFLSTKYESTAVYFDPPHVVVFSNFYPDKSKLSLDRWDIHLIDNTLLQ